MGILMSRKIKYPVTVTSKISGNVKDKLDIVAEAMDLTVSETIREILEDYLK